MSHGVRIWLTGCLAVVMAAVSAEFARAHVERPSSARHSPYGPGETLRKLEAAARGCGYSVLAKVSAPAGAASEGAALVLGLPEGVTPVLVDEQARRIDAPLALVVVALPDGRAEVRFREPPAAEAVEALGPEAADRLAAVIDTALA